MAESSAGLHEERSVLTTGTVDKHRATASLMEELEAIDWYDQRADATEDPELEAILIHNRDDEKEHAAMVLEWLRRRDPVLDAELRTFLFTSDPITALVPLPADHEPIVTAQPAADDDGSLGIGSLKGVQE